MKATTQQRAEELIRATGARLTRPRTRVLAYLLGQKHPLTHHEIQQQLQGEPLDTVTLYRVLEWLTAHSIVHRIAGADQVWRFSTNGVDRSGKAARSAHDHAHFQCTQCDTVTCFKDIPLLRRNRMPPGFVIEEVDYLIKGVCPNCGDGK